MMTSPIPFQSIYLYVNELNSSDVLIPLSKELIKDGNLIFFNAKIRAKRPSNKWQWMMLNKKYYKNGVIDTIICMDPNYDCPIILSYGNLEIVQLTFAMADYFFQKAKTRPNYVQGTFKLIESINVIPGSFRCSYKIKSKQGKSHYRIQYIFLLDSFICLRTINSIESDPSSLKKIHKINGIHELNYSIRILINFLIFKISIF